jgi:glycosyltransferase involved in cell wall biosynthesis
MRIAMLGTRGVPARYGGFETAVEEIGQRLAARGHEVVVYCRGKDRSPSYLGMRRVRAPMLRGRHIETISHALASAWHVVAHRTDVALVFNAANAPVLPILRARGVPTAVHMDGLEWQRAKWGPAGQRYYLASERLCVRWANALIADSLGIQEYYRTRYGVETSYLAYGAPACADPAQHRLAELGLSPGGYHLAVARLEPENQVDLIVAGHARSGATLPLVVVGSVPYPGAYQHNLAKLADESGARMLGAIWDQELLDSLYAGAATYLHGHSVGGTNPSLLRAMGAGAPVIAYDVSFNREVVADSGLYFRDPTSLAQAIQDAEGDPELNRKRGRLGRQDVETRFSWDAVADGYERLCATLAPERP